MAAPFFAAGEKGSGQSGKMNFQPKHYAKRIFLPLCFTFFVLLAYKNIIYARMIEKM
jgi:hypothetical protein